MEMAILHFSWVAFTFGMICGAVVFLSVSGLGIGDMGTQNLGKYTHIYQRFETWKAAHGLVGGEVSKEKAMLGTTCKGCGECIECEGFNSNVSTSICKSCAQKLYECALFMGNIIMDSKGVYGFDGDDDRTAWNEAIFHDEIVDGIKVVIKDFKVE